MPRGGRPARGRRGSRFVQGHRLPPTTTAPSTSGASPSSSYHDSFHKRFTLLRGTTLSLLPWLLPLVVYILHKFYL
ncbi:hypothetical protein Taro_054305 [Colocasia esculenta]|uniref:Uncharacterized protein n=1 Tax=Colocasia esculenta TaxID=4460 RepID=A0A843XN60_COLES|nr:hypothetical protein [Colocasia esculenta]